jgi:Protein of unknown function (DUF3626)
MEDKSPRLPRSGRWRDLWEDRLFGGAYHGAGVTSPGRPKYGALDVMHYPDGPAPRFGSCFFLLRPDVANRSTFTFGGSHEDRALDRTGTRDVMEPVFAPLLSQLESGKGAFAVAMRRINNGLPGSSRRLNLGQWAR